MTHSFFTTVLRLPEFKGKWRLVNMLRQRQVPYRRRVKYGIEMELDPFEWAQVYLAQHDVTEPQTMELMRSLLRPGDTYFDVGAHVGFVSLVCRQAVGANGRVIALEPQPYNCQRVLRNWELNGFNNLELYVAAAGENDDTIKLPQQTATDKSRLSLALPMADALNLFYTVPLLSLRTVMDKADVKSIRLLKIDVEGFELSVLKGLHERIKDVEYVVFEALEEGGSLEVYDFLEKNNFEIQTIDRKPWNRTWPMLEGNLLAIRR